MLENHHFSSDAAENSIMQTITIAVSAILIAAGLVTAPGLINNARDNNATTDLANIAYAQEYLLANQGTYTSVITPSQAVDGQYLGNQEGIKYTLSGKIDAHRALVCNDPVWSYLIKATSSSGKTFYRASTSAKTSISLSDLVIPACIASSADYTSFLGGMTPLTFTTPSGLAEGRVGTPISIQLATATTSASTVGYAVTSGALPGGLNLSNSGLLSGTPTASGAFSFDVTAGGSGIVPKTANFTITVVDPQITSWAWTTRSTSALTGYATDIASSKDGSILLASTGTGVSRSINGGTSWQTMAIGNGTWAQVAVSDDGVYMVVSRTNNGVWISKNGGSTWTQTLGGVVANDFPGYSGIWTGITSDSTGQYIMVASTAGSYYSTDYGESWARSTISPTIVSLAMNADGSKIIGTTSTKVYISSDHGATFTLSSLTSSVKWQSVNISDDGTRIHLGSSAGRSAYSADGGSTWTSITVPEFGTTATFIDSVMSGDGKRLGAIIQIGSVTDLYTSQDYGLTWVVQTVPGLTLDAANRITANSNGEKMYITKTGGLNMGGATIG